MSNNPRVSTKQEHKKDIYTYDNRILLVNTKYIGITYRRQFTHHPIGQHKRNYQKQNIYEKYHPSRQIPNIRKTNHIIPYVDLIFQFTKVHFSTILICRTKVVNLSIPIDIKNQFSFIYFHYKELPPPLKY